MLTVEARLRPFAYLGHGAAGALMDRVAEAIATDSAAQALLSHPGVEVMSDVKARAKPGQTPVVKAFYWSVQCPDAGVWGGLRARTLIADKSGMVWMDMADDPALPALAALRAVPGRWRVLRYVPLRRATLRHDLPEGGARIVKVKRPHRAADAARRLAAVQAALCGTSAFSVPALLEDAVDGVFALSFCQGRSLAAGLGAEPAGMLRRIGGMHARLHAASTEGLPAEEDSSVLQDNEPWLALRPDLAPQMGRLRAILADRPSPGALSLCHGDLSFDQMLWDGRGLSLVDLDRSHAGDAGADIARFLVHLAENLPSGLQSGAAFGAYLEGYAGAGDLPGRDRLAWFMAEAVMARMTVRLRKDQAEAAAMRALLGLVDNRGWA